MVAFLWSGFIQSSLCFTFIQTTPAPLLGYCAGYHCVVNLYYNWVILQVCLRGSVEPMAKRSVGSSPDATRHNPRSDPEPSLLSIRKSSILRWRHPEKDWFEFRAAFLWRELPNVVKCQIVTIMPDPRSILGSGSKGTSTYLSPCLGLFYLLHHFYATIPMFLYYCFSLQLMSYSIKYVLL